MKGTIFNQFKGLFRNYQKWFYNTPDRALDRAYQAALMIKSIEDDHFNGKKVSAESVEYGDSVITYFQSKVDQHLKTIKLRLTEFESSSSILTLSEANLNPQIQAKDLKLEERSAVILEKLTFIDQITAKYRNKSLSLVKVSNNQNLDNSQKLTIPNTTNLPASKSLTENNQNLNYSKPNNPVETVSDKTGVLPRSILRTFSRIKQEIDPKSNEAEEEVVKKFRVSRNKTAISIKFLLLLVIIPLLTHQLTKIAIAPIIQENFFTDNPKITWFQPIKLEVEESAKNEENDTELSLELVEQKLFINKDLQEEAWMELQEFEESLKLKSLVGIIPKLSEEETTKLIKEKSEEIVEEFRYRSHDALSNVFSDFFSFIAFVIVLIISRKEIIVLKSFLDEIVYGLSDSAKAFLIILFTDIFVGYHSPHGWEIILESISRHLGIPENRDFNFLFIATFPVILDTVLKYWIFRYLNRISPSAVATYRNMNE